MPWPPVARLRPVLCKTLEKCAVCRNLGGAGRGAVARSKPDITLGTRPDPLQRVKGRRICERQCHAFLTATARTALGRELRREAGSRKQNRTRRLFNPAMVYD